MAGAYFTQDPRRTLSLPSGSTSASTSTSAGLCRRGVLYLAEGPTEEGGWWTFDVWASAEDFETLLQQTLQPALGEFNAHAGKRRQLQVQW